MTNSNNFENNKSGFVAIIGPPNAGKSTFLNKVLGMKISITSKKPQTTRNRIVGVLTRSKSQFIFIDTPGVHKAKGVLNERIVDVAVSAISDVDLVLLLIDAVNKDSVSEQLILKQLEKQKRPVILALNKIDLLDKNILLGQIDKWSKSYPFESIIPVSAKTGVQVDDLLDAMEISLPKGPFLYPEDTLTESPTKFIVAEIIREKAFRLTGQELPYSVAVTIDLFQEKKRGSMVKIFATIHVERDSQKKILIGKNGSKIKQIGQSARLDIEKILNTKIFLKLFIRVQKNWSKDTKALRNFGY